MNIFKSTLCLLLSFAMTMCFYGCTDSLTPSETVPSDPQAALTLLDAAYEAVEESPHRKLNIVFQKSVSTPQNGYDESYVQSLTYENYGQDSLRAHSQTIYTCGESRIYLEEFYADGSLFTSVNNNRFCGKMDAASYCAQWIPAVLISPDRYQGIEVQSTAVSTILSFSDAISAESWCNIEPDSLKSASATVTLDTDGQLTESTYTLCYTYGETEICNTITVRIHTIQPNAIQQIADANSYLPIEHPLLPFQLELAAAHLAQADSISSFIQETSISQATDMQHTLTTQIQMTDADPDLRAAVFYESQLIDFSRDGETTAYHQSEQFENGAYSFVDPYGELHTDPTVDAAAAKEHLLNLLVQNIATPNHILNTAVGVTNDAEVLEFTLDEEMAQHLKQYACNVLSMDDSLLDSLAQSYRTEYVQFTLSTDRITGFPAEITIRYAGEHIIEGQAYQLTYSLTQTFDFNGIH